MRFRSPHCVTSYIFSTGTPGDLFVVMFLFWSYLFIESPSVHQYPVKGVLEDLQLMNVRYSHLRPKLRLTWVTIGWVVPFLSNTLTILKKIGDCLTSLRSPLRYEMVPHVRNTSGSYQGLYNTSQALSHLNAGYQTILRSQMGAWILRFRACPEVVNNIVRLKEVE